MAQTSTISLETLPHSHAASTIRLNDPKNTAAEPTALTASDPTTPTDEVPPPAPARSSSFIAVVTTTIATTLTCFTSGILTPALPAIAASTNLDSSLLLWPQSINALVSACTLLLCGSLSDVFGAKNIYVLGAGLQAAFVLGVALSKNAAQLLVFRGLSGLSQSMILPSCVSIIMQSFAPGRGRNAAFAAMGGGQPLGFSVGLVLGGVFVDAPGVGWRAGFYIAAALSAVVCLMAAFGLDSKTGARSGARAGAGAETKHWSTRLRTEIDWVGALLISGSLACLCYVLASITADLHAITHPENLTLLILSIVLIPAFIAWESRQERARKPALIPNRFWKNTVFASICGGVFFAWGAFMGGEQLVSLWLQLVQRNSALQTSIRLLPESVMGVLVNVFIGATVHKFRSDSIITGSMLLTLASSILMALNDPAWTYWQGVFPVMALMVVGPDCLYTISNLVVSKQFPDESQGLAGGVFNTVAQVGKSVGLALSGVVTSSVMSQGGPGPDSLVKSYQAGFWFCVGLNSVTIFLSVWGLRKVGKIGAKEE